MDNTPTDIKVSPVVHIFQFITNIANDGKLYKSSEEEIIESEVVETEQIILMKNEEGIFEEITVNEETTTVEEILEPVVAKRGAKKK